MPRKNPATGDPILDALRAERERRGWSQTELAQRIGRATYQTAYNWESGHNEPTLSSLREWAGALGYNVALVPLPAEQPEPPPPGASYCAKCREWDMDPVRAPRCPTCGQPWSGVAEQPESEGPTFEKALSDPHLQCDPQGELLPHLIAFGQPTPTRPWLFDDAISTTLAAEQPEPARSSRNDRGLIVGIGMRREPGRETCALYCDECGELRCSHRPETLADEQPEPDQPARIHVRHDPAARMEEPDLYADEKPEPASGGIITRSGSTLVAEDGGDYLPPKLLPDPDTDPALCPKSRRVDGPFHSTRWDGDDARTVCVFCGQVRDALSGEIIREGADEKPEGSDR